METKEKIKGNILISTLFGEPLLFNDSRRGKIMLYFKPGHTTAHCVNYELEYNESWEWLMPAWVKFRNTVWQENQDSYPSGFIKFSEDWKTQCFNGNITHAFYTLCAAIEWYNTQKS